MDQKENEASKQSLEQPQPVAYDAKGRPLYAAPPPVMMKPGGLTTPQAVHVSRAVEPIEPLISDEVRVNHDQSVKDYPSLSLSESEYIVSAIPRHPIGRVIPLGISLFFVVLIASLVFSYPKIIASLGVASSAPAFSLIAIAGLLLIFVVVVMGYAAAWVYSSNKLFLTNESVIQEIQAGLFSHNEQTVSLMNVEDVSYDQNGIMQMMLNYGSIRLSTEGEEASYRLAYVADPKKQIAVLDNAVESFKNGRPITINK